MVSCLDIPHGTAVVLTGAKRCANERCVNPVRQHERALYCSVRCRKIVNNRRSRRRAGMQSRDAIAAEFEQRLADMKEMLNESLVANQALTTALAALRTQYEAMNKAHSDEARRADVAEQKLASKR